MHGRFQCGGIDRRDCVVHGALHYRHGHAHHGALRTHGELPFALNPLDVEVRMSVRTEQAARDRSLQTLKQERPRARRVAKLRAQLCPQAEVPSRVVLDVSCLLEVDVQLLSRYRREESYVIILRPRPATPSFRVSAGGSRMRLMVVRP